MKIRAAIALLMMMVLAACAAPEQPVVQVNETSPPENVWTTTPPPQSQAEDTAAVPVTGGETPQPIPTPLNPSEQLPEIQEYPVPTGSHPHDVAPAADGTVWYTAQATGELGLLDPLTAISRLGLALPRTVSSSGRMERRGSRTAA
jgi:streptogramin lyase